MVCSNEHPVSAPEFQSHCSGLLRWLDIAPLSFQCLLRSYGLLRWASSVCSVRMVCFVELSVSAPLVRFAPLKFQCLLRGIVSSVGDPESVPSLRFAPLEF